MTLFRVGLVFLISIIYTPIFAKKLHEKKERKTEEILRDQHLADPDSHVRNDRE